MGETETDAEVMHLWTLRVKIDGEWLATDFERFFRLIDELYALAIGVDIDGQGTWFDALIQSRMRQRKNPDEGVDRWLGLYEKQYGRTPNPYLKQKRHLDLDVLRVEFGSPGFADFLGFGVAIGHMKDIIVKIIDLATTREQRALDTVGKRLDLQAKQIQNAREFVQLVSEARGADLDEGKLRELVIRTDVLQGELLPFVERGQLTGADIVDAPP
jgi:hypothetical protein